MDTSKEYIEMCRKAKEIQDIWQPEEGGYVGSGEVWQDWMGESKIEPVTRQPYTWLPRQDQLQEILLEDESIGVIHTEFNDFCLGDYSYPGIMGSYQNYMILLLNWADDSNFELLWLAFFMKKCYNKIWNYEDWVSL